MLAVRRASSLWLVGAVSVLLTSAPLALPRDVMAESEPLDVIGPVIDGRRVEQPAYGFTITFPDDWTVRSATPEGPEAYWGESETTPGQSLVLAAERSPQSGHCLVTFDDPSERDEPVLLAWYADWIESGWGQDVNQHVFKRTQVELPAGPAWRIDYAADWWTGSVFTLRGPKGLYTLECWSDQVADGRWERIVDDDWQRVAESIRFTDDTSTGSVGRSPVVRGGRIERPDDGFAVTFPSGWTVEPVTDQTHQIMFSVLEPSDRTRQRTLLAAGSQDGYCVVVDSNPLAQESPERRSIYAATGSFLAGLAADSDIIGPQSIIEELSAGPTGHITATDIDGWTIGQYHFTDSDTWVYLDCRSPTPPLDGWISIAETFEFLPSGE